MKYERPVCRFIAVYEDHWEIREGTSDDMDKIVYEFCDDKFQGYRSMKTFIPGVYMLLQSEVSEMTDAKHVTFANPFSSVFERTIDMNFVLFGFDGYGENGDDDIDPFFDYRSLTDEEISQCLQLLESVSVPERKVFLGGSQTWTALPEKALSSLNCWMRRHIAFLVGDSKGADKLMQQYLHEKGYEKVTVFVSGDEVRCNEGDWNVVHCASSAQPHSDEFYSAKDIRMAEAADEAFLLWDGESHETHENIIRMRRLGKEVTVCREEAGWCWEEKNTCWYETLSDDKLQRYSRDESDAIRAAVRRCPGAKKELQLKRDEVFKLERSPQNGEPNPGPRFRRFFLSFADVLAVIGEDMESKAHAFPKPRYNLEKWFVRGEFNRYFYHTGDELIEVNPQNEDHHRELMTFFWLDGEEVVNFHLYYRR